MLEILQAKPCSEKLKTPPREKNWTAHEERNRKLGFTKEGGKANQVKN
jgi:hypothetical protein